MMYENCNSFQVYMPRRRFSYGAIQPIREMLQEIEDEENAEINMEKEALRRKRMGAEKKTAKKKKLNQKCHHAMKKTAKKVGKIKVAFTKSAKSVDEDEESSVCNTDDDFTELSRDEQMDRLQEGDAKDTGRV